jgi:hypothetical protein
MAASERIAPDSLTSKYKPIGAWIRRRSLKEILPLSLASSALGRMLYRLYVSNQTVPE